ncbi:MAG: YCF48-related protein, partial [Ignavibacteria bacterium]|nr:YCF48-related protein [Ignavibacteria bacterium]
IIQILLSYNLYSQWYWQNPKPQGNFQNDIYMLNNNVGMICGDAGTLIRTTNGGLNWIYQPLNNSNSIIGLQFLNANNVIAVGYDYQQNGVIYKSTNGGLNFILDTTLINIPINSEFFLDDNNWWFGSSNGKVLFTSNSGITWLIQSTPVNSTITGIHFINIDTGFAVTFEGHILKTVNRGQTWQIVLNISSYNRNFYSVYFYDSNLGFAMGGSIGLLYITTNGGTNWTDISNQQLFGTYVFDIIFINQYTGYMATGDENYSKGIFKTTNGGFNWFSQNVYLKCDECLTKLYVCDSNTIYAVGDYGAILKTTNSGINWFYQSEGVLKWLTSIDFIDENTGFLNAITNIYSNSIFKSTNGGESWDSVASFDVLFIDILALNYNVCIAIGENGKIVRTSNGGLNWYFVESGISSQSLTGITFSNQYTGWICSYNGMIIKSTDMGNTWIKIAETSKILHDIFFIDELKGFACGEGKVYKSSDGGLNWLEINTPTQLKLLTIRFINQNTGWCAGEYGVILKSTNAGENWTIKNSNTIQHLIDIEFVNENTGFICGIYNTILKSTDAGNNWVKTYLPNVSDFFYYFSLDFINENTGWVAGPWAIILKTTNAGSVFITKNNLIIPENFNLYQNYPNPFNSSTKIKFEIPKSFYSRNTFVQLKIYDITGREIETIFQDYLSEGVYEITYTPKDLSSGVYFYSLILNNKVITKKMVFIK